VTPATLAQRRAYILTLAQHVADERRNPPPAPFAEPCAPWIVRDLAAASLMDPMPEFWRLVTTLEDYSDCCTNRGGFRTVADDRDEEQRHDRFEAAITGWLDVLMGQAQAVAS
jgi:hypothetical protein